MTAFEAFFGFNGAPFSRDIPVNQLLETASGKELQGRLNYVARMRAFGVFTGDAGMGKTTQSAVSARDWTSIGTASSISLIRRSHRGISTGRLYTNWDTNPDSTGV